MPPVNAARAIGTVLLAAGILACSERDGPGPSGGDPWPLALRDATVLGYAVVCVEPAVRDGLLQETLGWSLQGLAADRPVGVVRLDTATFGGPAAVLLPVDDGAAFLASLAASPGVESLGSDRYRFRPPLESGLGVVLMLASGWDSRSPMDMLSSVGEVANLEFLMEVRVEDGHALAVPSFEALAVCREFLDEVRGFTRIGPTEVLLSMDLAQVRIVYAKQLRNVDQQLRSLVAGASLAGPAALLPFYADGGGGDAVPSINWDLTWALRAMLDLDAVDALQVHAAAPATPSVRPDDSLAGLLGSVSTARLRTRFAGDSTLEPVLRSLRPVPDDLDAVVLMAADPDRFARAFAAWCRPLADFAKGEGAPSDRYVQLLEQHLSRWDGLLGVFDPPGGGPSPVILASVRDGGLGVADVVAWLSPLLASAGVEALPGDGSVEDAGGGRQRVRDASGDVVLTIGRSGPVQWFVPGEADGPPADLLIRFAGARGAADGPGLLCAVRGARVALRHEAGELRLDVTLPGAD
jgi:hypothetical protein